MKKFAEHVNLTFTTKRIKDFIVTTRIATPMEHQIIMMMVAKIGRSRMSKQEAIKMLNEMLKNCNDELEFGLDDEVDEYTRRAIDVYETAICALEKQIPKKPDFEGDGYVDGYLAHDIWICPCCEKHYEVDYDDYKHCPNCGQTIDWEVSDD